MDLNVTTGAATAASSELPSARTSAKGGHGHGAHFGLALLTELGLQAQGGGASGLPDAETPGEALPGVTKATGRGEDLLEKLMAGDSDPNAAPDSATPALSALDLLAMAAASQLQPTPFVPPAVPLAPPLQASTAAAMSETLASVRSTREDPHGHTPVHPEPGAGKLPAVPDDLIRAQPEAATPLAHERRLPEDAARSAPPVRELGQASSPEKAASREHASSHEEPSKHEDSPGTAPLASGRPAAEHALAQLEHVISRETPRPEISIPPPSGPDAIASAAPPPLTPPNVPHFTSTHAPPPVTAQVAAPFGSAEWGDQFRDKVVWLVDRQQQTAELHMHPPHLGPVEVMLTLNDDKTNIAFVSPHPAVREAIEASFADLRSTLEQRGLSLGHASVSADSRDAREQLPPDPGAARRMITGGVAAVDEPRAARVALQYGLVDTFA